MHKTIIVSLLFNMILFIVCAVLFEVNLRLRRRISDLHIRNHIQSKIISDLYHSKATFKFQLEYKPIEKE